MYPSFSFSICKQATYFNEVFLHDLYIKLLQQCLINQCEHGFCLSNADDDKSRYELIQPYYHYVHSKLFIMKPTLPDWKFVPYTMLGD